MKSKIGQKSSGQQETVSATREQVAAIQKRIHDAIRIHGETLARIAIDGGVAIVVVDPIGRARKAAQIAGWNGTSPSLWRMDNSFRKQLIKNSDAVTAAWLSGQRPYHARIFVFMERGTLLVNHTPTTGFYFGPASLDAERA